MRKVPCAGSLLGHDYFYEILEHGVLCLEWLDGARHLPRHDASMQTHVGLLQMDVHAHTSRHTHDCASASRFLERTHVHRNVGAFRFIAYTQVCMRTHKSASVCKFLDKRM